MEINAKDITVKPGLRGHIWDKEKLFFKDRWPLKRSSVFIKFSMTGQETRGSALSWACVAHLTFSSEET